MSFREQTNVLFKNYHLQYYQIPHELHECRTQDAATRMPLFEIAYLGFKNRTQLYIAP